MNRTLPSQIFQVDDLIANKIVWFLSTEPVREIINSSIRMHTDQQVEIYHGHDDTVPHFPNIVVESVNERDTRVATGVITAYHTYNIIPQIRRVQREPAERMIRKMATAVKQVMYNLQSFSIEVADDFTCMVWDTDQPTQINYGYRQAKTIRAGVIQWTYKVDIPLGKMYVGGNSMPDGI